jgi:hypothetical protein
VNRTHGQMILPEDYNFLIIDGEVNKFHQSNDTLYNLQCYISQPCQPKPSDHYKILSVQGSGKYKILKLEKLDTIPLTNDPTPQQDLH